jgi:hypothetical protein
MDIGRDSRTIIRFAMAGVVTAVIVAAAFFTFLKSHPPDNWITTSAVLLAVVLCPGVIPFAWAAGVELEMPSLSVISVINLWFMRALEPPT